MQEKWRGAAEYFLLFAVVLIVALVSVALLGAFPSMAADARITQSQSYWRGARPFAILDHSITVAEDGKFVLQNTEASGTYTITSITVGGCTNSTAVSFAPGEVKTVALSLNCGKADAKAGDVYDFEVDIKYTKDAVIPSSGVITGMVEKDWTKKETSEIFEMTQRGAKRLVGRYQPEENFEGEEGLSEIDGNDVLEEIVFPGEGEIGKSGE